MRFRRQDPLEGPKTLASWSAMKVKGGTGQNVYLIGDTLWFWSHYVGVGSIPCFWEFTDKAVACPHCKPSVRAYWQGYTPCKDESGRKLLALPKYDNKPVIEAIGHGAAVWVSRSAEKNAPMTVVAKKGSPRVNVTEHDLAALADLEASLIQMWKNPVLRAWFDSQPVLPAAVRQNMEAASHAKAESEKKNHEFVASVRAALPVKRASDNAVSIEDALPPVVANGVHKRK